MIGTVKTGADWRIGQNPQFSRRSGTFHREASAFGTRFHRAPLGMRSGTLCVLKKLASERRQEELRGQGNTPGAGRETDERLHEVWIQPRGRPTDLHQVPQDLTDLFRLGNHGKDPHRRAASTAGQGINLVHLGDKARPGRTAFLIKHS